MSGRHRWSELRNQMMKQPGADEAVEKARADAEDELRLCEFRDNEHAERIDLAGPPEITRSAAPSCKGR